MTWQESRMSDLAAIADDCEEQMVLLGEEMDEAEDEGDTELAKELRREYMRLMDRRDNALDEYAQVDEGFIPADYDPYYPSMMDIAEGWM